MSDLKLVSNYIDHYLASASADARSTLVSTTELILDEVGCESPIEDGLLIGFIARWMANRMWRLPGVETFYAVETELSAKIYVQREVGRFRPDFAVHVTASGDGRFLDRWIAIECDRHDFHSSKRAMRRDRSKDRELSCADILVVRFTGSEIFENAAGCAMEVEQIITEIYGRWRGSQHPDAEPWGVRA